MAELFLDVGGDGRGVIGRTGEAAVHVASAGFLTGRGVDATLRVPGLRLPETSSLCARRVTDFCPGPIIFEAAILNS